MRILLTYFICLLFALNVNGQENEQEVKPVNKARFIGTSSVLGVGWVSSILSLKYVWYSQFDKSKFHFFDDAHEWQQMDKLGHTTTAWNLARISGDLYKWSGIDHKKSALIGSGFSFAYLTTFEFLDAYNSKWGFSWSDMGANTFGSLLYFSQAYFWDKQLVKIKFSIHQTELAKYRPNVLGEDFLSRAFKDYNGQTYWLTWNSFNLLQDKVKVPKWITLAVGYSINNQISGDGGIYIIQENGNQINFEPYRQLFFSIDFDLEEIPVKAKWLKVVLRGLNIIKIPMPTLELSQGKLAFHPLYF